MRNTRDRIRQAVGFELIGLAIVTPLGAWIYDHPMQNIGVIAIVGATLATVWNYFFNLLFDHAMQRHLGYVQKSVYARILHAVLFELGLLLALMPFIAWFLEISLLQAFLMDVSFSLFFMVYTFVYSWAYDVIFPVPMHTEPDTGQPSE